MERKCFPDDTLVDFPIVVIELIESYLTNVFVLQDGTIYMFDGKLITAYYKLPPIPAQCDSFHRNDLVYANDLGLCFRWGDEIQCINKNGELELVPAPQTGRLEFIGGNELRINVNGKLHSVSGTVNFANVINNTILSCNQFVISFGGLTRSSTKSGTRSGKIAPVIIYDTMTSIITEGEPFQSDCCLFAAVARDDCIYVFGGCELPITNVTTNSNRVERFDLKHKNWKRCNSMPHEVYDITAVSIGKYIYIIGCDPTMRLEVASDTWEIVSGCVFTQGCSAASVHD